MVMFRPLVLVIILLSLFSVKSEAQTSLTTEVHGRVIDAITKEPISEANIRFPHTITSTVSDPKGMYHIKSIERGADSISFSYLGYRTRTVAITRGKSQELDITLGSEDIPMIEMTVKPKKRQKPPKHVIDTAALYVFHHVVENKSKNTSAGINDYKYEYYDKLQIALLNPSQKFMNFFLFKPFRFVFKNVDTTADGDVFIPGILKESVGQAYHREKPRANKKYVSADIISGIENPSIGNLANYQFAEINIYDNLYVIANSSFIAPFASAANITYNYYMMDTSKVEGRTTYHLAFTGVVKEDLALQGQVWVDSATWGIRSITFRPNRKSNINFLTDYTVHQDYSYVNNKYWIMNREELHTVGSLFKKKHETSLLVTKIHNCRNIVTDLDLPDSLFKAADQQILLDSARERSPKYWDTARFEPLTKQEKEVYHIVDTIKLLKVWKTYEGVARFATAAFIDVGPISIGRVLNFASKNNVEGWRLRLGFETNPRFQHTGTPANTFLKKFYFSAYGAYGLKDHVYQYQGLMKINLPHKNDHWQGLSVMYRYDMRLPGQDEAQSVLTFDNIFSLVGGTTFSKIMRLREFRIDYEKEWVKGFSTIFTANQQTYYAVDSVLRFVRPEHGVNISIPHFSVTEFMLDSRYSYNDLYFISNFYRFFLVSKYPVFTFRYIAGIVNMQREYSAYHNFQISIKQRLSSPLGHTNYLIRAGKILGAAPFTTWYFAQGNLGYLLDKFNYNLITEFEFATDQYASVWIEHHFDGFFFNRIPLLNKLKLREVVYIKSLIGNYSQKNADILQIPSTLMSPAPIPYMEGGFAIENIASIIRVDFLWRLTYRNRPGEPNFGVKFAITPSF